MTLNPHKLKQTLEQAILKYLKVIFDIFKFYRQIPQRLKYKHKESTVFYRVQCTLFYIENDAEIFRAHYTWNVAEKGFKMAFMMTKLSMINSCEIIVER